MSAPPGIQGKEIQPRGLARQLSKLTVWLSLPGVALLATKPYFAEELLLFLAAFAILFAVGTAICLLIVVVHEGGRWSACKFNEAKQARVLLSGGLIAGSRRLELGARNASRRFST
jgi:hypothetical protein